MTYQLRPATRMPRLPDREAVPAEELADYDFLVSRIEDGFGPRPRLSVALPTGTCTFVRWR